ncbi:MAG: hypothetical protein AAF735_01835 [Myxococcota bacterium]
MNVIATWMGLFAFAFSASCGEWVASVRSAFATDSQDSVDGLPTEEQAPSKHTPTDEIARKHEADTAPGERTQPNRPTNLWEKILSPEQRAFDRETYQMWSRGEIEFLVDPELLNTEPDVHDETITTEQLRWMYEKLREVRQKEAAEKKKAKGAENRKATQKDDPGLESRRGPDENESSDNSEEP